MQRDWMFFTLFLTILLAFVLISLPTKSPDQAMLSEITTIGSLSFSTQLLSHKTPLIGTRDGVHPALLPLTVLEQSSE